MSESADNRVIHGRIPLILYAIACLLPPLRSEDSLGISALLMGWMGMFGHIPIFLAWLANFSFFLTLVLPVRQRPFRILLSFLSILLGLCFLRVEEIPVSEGGQTESVDPGWAFFVWMTAFFWLFFETVIYKKAASG